MYGLVQMPSLRWWAVGGSTHGDPSPRRRCPCRLTTLTSSPTTTTSAPTHIAPPLSPLAHPPAHTRPQARRARICVACTA